MSGAFWLILRAGLIETEDGDVDGALKSIGAALAVTRHATGRGEVVDSWSANHRYAMGALTVLAHWATRPEVDAPLIEHATQMIKEHLAAMPVAVVVSFGMHQRLRSIISDGPETIREWAGTDTRQDHDPSVTWMYRFPGETLRMRRIVDWSHNRQSHLVAEFESHGRSEARGGMGSAYRLLNSKLRDARLQLARWSKTTPSLRRLHETWTKHDFALDIHLRTKAAATILTMQLLLAERRDGQFPDSLDGMPVEFKDPWTGEPFTWYPQGVPQKVKSGYATIPPDRPFLLSAGPNNASIQRIEYEDVPIAAMGARTTMGMGGQGVAAPGLPGELGAAPAQPQPADNPAPDGDADAPDSKVKTIVEYVIRQQHSGSGTGPTIFFIPRPEQESQPE